MELTNLVGVIPGTDPSAAPVLIMAHLDHLGFGWPDVRRGNEGLLHPGADDNASGVAVMLEVARHMAAGPRPLRTVIFAAVTGEEAGRIGSRRLLESMEVKPHSCLNLDTVGRFGTGGLLVLGTESAREFPHIFMGIGYTTGVASTIVAEPLDASDQVSCMEHGVPAVQLFTGANADYHRPTDTAAGIDGPSLARVAEVAAAAAEYLAGREEPLHSNVEAGAAPKKPQASRKVSLGTMPDFAFPGPGGRGAGVMEGSAAAAAALEAGDVILAVDGEEISDLRSYSKLLKACAPGQTIRLRVRRGGEEIHVPATLRAR